jgi:hypothetical protein
MVRGFVVGNLNATFETGTLVRCITYKLQASSFNPGIVEESAKKSIRYEKTMQLTAVPEWNETNTWTTSASCALCPIVSVCPFQVARHGLTAVYHSRMEIVLVSVICYFTSANEVRTRVKARYRGGELYS